jgi:hypothetical protein
MKKYILILSSLLLIGFLTNSCSKENDDSLDTILKAAATGGGLVAYKNTPHDTITNSNSPHGRFTIWFNNIAVDALDPNTGELAPGGTFPTGSLIVKTRYAHIGGPAIGYLVIKKDPSNSLAENGYVWGEYNIDGTVVHSANEKGNTCIGCHSTSPNRDFIRVFDIL